MPRTSRQTTLARKLLWAVLPIVLAALGGLGLSTYFVAKGQVIDGLHSTVRWQARQLSTSLSSFFDQGHRDVDTLADVESLKEYFKNLDLGLLDEAQKTYRLATQEYALRFLNRARNYTSILFFDDKHKPIVSAGRKELRFDNKGQLIVRDDYKYQLFDDAGKPAAALRSDTSPDQEFSRLGIDQYDGRPVVQGDGKTLWVRYTETIRDSDGAPRGVVVLTSDLTDATDRLTQAKSLLGEHASAYIADAARHVVLGIPLDNPSAIDAPSEMPGLGWTVHVAADPDEFLRPVVRLRNLSLSLMGLVAIFAPLVLVMAVRRSTHPIVDLVAGTRKLAAGELDYRFPIPDIRELAVLADSFNDMAGKLKGRETDLRSRIRQLTALREMENSVVQRLNEEAILRTCLNSVAAGLGFDRTGLYWVDQQQGVIAGRYLHQIVESPQSTEEGFRRRRVPLGTTDILNQIIQTHQPVLATDPGDEAAADGQGAGARRVVMAPICGKDRVFGVLTADNLLSGRPLEESDRDGLMLFAGAAGLALENTGLFDKLSVSEARHRLVLDNSPVAILGLAENFTITTWNRGAEAMFGHAADEVIGRPIESLFPNNPDDYARLVGDVGRRGGVREYAISGVNKKKQPLDLMLSWDGSTPDGAANKEWAVVIRDVTDAKKMQRQLIFSEKLSAVGQLISGIAHELNNPLQAVVGYAEMLNVPRLPGAEMPTREIKHISDNANRCRKIIDNLLLFVRQGEVRKTTVKVQDVVRASLELLQHKIKKTAGVQVTADLPEEPLYAKANFQQIEQVIVNITNNACDAMEGWEGPRRLQISARATGSIIRVSLADTGPGIPEEVCARIFEPFFTTKPEGRGTGLGLPVCRQIVNDHGGDLHVETKIGTGTTFWFELALAQPEAPREEPPAGNAAPAIETPAGGSSLLLVEDEPAIRELLEEVLAAAGHRVQSAASVEAASAKAAGATFDLVVSDVQLEDGTGVDLFHNWATATTNARPPFLFLSGDILSGAIGDAANEDDVYMLQKPVDLKELCALINTIVAKHHSQVA